MSNLALPAQKSVTGVDANHLMFCLFSDGAVKEDLFDLFSFKYFCICSKNQNISESDHTSTKPKGKFSMEFTFSSKHSRKCNRFSIVIVKKLHD